MPEKSTPATGFGSTTDPEGVAPQQDSTGAVDNPASEANGTDDRRDRRYRQRLRETEETLQAEREQWNAERSQHQQTIERFQRREVERAAAQAHMRTPADIWTSRRWVRCSPTATLILASLPH